MYLSLHKSGFSAGCFSRLILLYISVKTRGQIRPAILQNPGMDTFRPTEPLSPWKDTLILLWPFILGQNVLFWENLPTIPSILADTLFKTQL